jgi:hypothetical protein
LLNHLVGAATTHPLVKAVAALIHVRLQGVSVDKAIVRTLLDILVQGDLIEEWNRDVSIPPYGSCDFVFHFAEWTLRFLAPQMGEFVLPSLLEIFHQREQAFRRHSLSDSSGASFTFALSIELVHAWLYFAFGETHLPQNAIPFLLTKTQRSVLTTLLTSELVATDELAERFTLFGLPVPWKARLLLGLEAEPQTMVLSREDDVLEQLW